MMKLRAIFPEDRNDIEEIARGTWDGEDYLPSVFREWLRDGYFYGIEENNKIIATGKITVLPDYVGWLEGLRVHLDYRGRGYGKKMHEFLLKKAKELKDMGIIRTLEYATYFKNAGSIHLGLNTGFQVVKRYYGMDYEGTFSEKPDKSYLCSIDEFDYEDYIPCGWTYLHKTEDAVKYLEGKCMIFSYKGHKFLIPKDYPEDVTSLTLEVSTLKVILPALLYFSPTNRVSIRIPDNLNYMVYESIGFRKWENIRDAEILILKKSL